MSLRDALRWGSCGRIHTGNGPLTDDDLVNREVVGEELPGQPPREYAEQRDPETAGELPEELPKGIVQRLPGSQRLSSKSNWIANASVPIASKRSFVKRRLTCVLQR